MQFTFPREDYDMLKTLTSGQVFRYKILSDNQFRVHSANRVCIVTQEKEQFIVDTLKDLFDDDYNYWTNYFDFDGTINFYNMIKDDVFLKEVYDCNRGLHLLNQDPWETLISFIISQQKRIPQIQASIEKICDLAGAFNSYGFRSFPTAQDLMQNNIWSANLGYRLKYVMEVAREEANHELDIQSLRYPNHTYSFVMNRLCSLYGVGVKVASCVALFSLGFRNAFPVDTHISKILALPQMIGFKPEDYGDYAGLLQQYFFTYALAHGL